MYSMTSFILRLLLVAATVAGIVADSQKAFAVDAAKEEARAGGEKGGGGG